MNPWRGSARWVAGMLLATAVICPTASAQERASQLASPVRGPNEWAVDVMLATAIPTALGGEVRVETPGRFPLSVMVGGNPYGDGLASERIAAILLQRPFAPFVPPA